MDIYVLDQDFEILSLLEGYSSFIWTERFDAYGDFTFTIPLTYSQSSNLALDNYLYHTQSKTLMIVERYSRISYETGERNIKVEGRSLVSILLDKVSPGYKPDNPLSASDIVASLVHRVCVLGSSRYPRDVIPNLTVIWPAQFGDVLDYDEGPGILYNKIQKLAKDYDFGFSMEFDIKDKTFTFKVLRGVDRSSVIVYSPILGNLEDVNFLRSREEYKNVAYVYHRDVPNMMVLYRRGHENVRGLDRKVLFVDASSLRNPQEWNMRKLGYEALEEHGGVSVIDGEVIDDSYGYNQDYNLGDIVMVNDGGGRYLPSRVSEYMWAHDHDGVRSYPTFREIES